MKKLDIELNQDYKQFKNGFKTTLEGDLIILSGINGSGKSQLMDILNMYPSQIANNVPASEKKKYAIKASISIDNETILKKYIFKRTFKDNINIENTVLPNPKNSIWNKEEAWKCFSNYFSWVSSNMDYEKSKAIVEKELKQKSYKGAPEYDSNSISKTKLDITKDEFFKVLGDDFIWRKDDLFSNQIDELFYSFATKRHDEQARLGLLQGGFDNEESLKKAPWTLLNNLFERLNFNYRFKKDYEYETPNLKETPMIYPILSNGKIDETSPRELKDLSDGEKSIISLTFALINEETRPIEKLLLLDEFDNTLNPSLIKALFIVLEEYFIKKGTMVIITTHSPVTISLAPEYAKHYELFKQDNDSPKIISVNKDEYSELEIANKAFYEKIENQEERIKLLEKNIEELKAQKIVFVEDTYTQIYKVAWLKINNIEFDINNVESVFEEKAPFKIFSKTSKDSLKGFLANLHMDEQNDKKILGLFDFDDAYVCFSDLKTNWSEICGTEENGLYKVRTDYPNIYAMLLPVPSYRKKLASKEQTIKRLEVELLFNDEDLETLLGKENKKEVLFEGFEIPKINNKSAFWKKTIVLDKEKFSAFEILYNKIYELLNIK